MSAQGKEGRRPTQPWVIGTYGNSALKGPLILCCGDVRAEGKSAA